MKNFIIYKLKIRVMDKCCYVVPGFSSSRILCFSAKQKQVLSGQRFLFSTSKDGVALNKIKREKFYLDAAESKSDVIKENGGKSGIYLWENRINGKIYIGSSTDLKRRLTTYYNLNHLTNNPTRYINNALLKDGYSAFSLYILEYCSDEKNLINREQYYFYLLNPTYNICKTAGSTLGRLHTDESKEKIRGSKLNTNVRDDNHFYGKIHSEEAREKMAKSKLSTVLSEEVKEKISATMFGRKFTEEHKINLSLSKKNRKMISVLNIKTNETTVYSSISQAERSLGLPKDSIRVNLKSKSGVPYRGLFQFAYVDVDK